MAIQQTRIILSAHYPGGKPVEPDFFLAGLGVDVAPYKPYGRAGQWHAVGLEIATIRIDDFERFETERYEEYETATQGHLVAFAGWLATIPTVNFTRLQATGLEIYVLVNLLMDQDQMDFVVPPELSFQLGRLQMRLSLNSNE